MKQIALQLERITKRFDIRDIYVFGSRAEEIATRVRGDGSISTAPDSDVDIAVQPVRGCRLDASDRVRLAIELEDMFGSTRIDLVVLSEARPFLALDAIRGELLHTADPRAQAEQELYILRRAADLSPFQRERVTQVLSGGAR